MSWADHAAAVIAKVDASLPVGSTLEERVKAVDAAYPFGERANFPYKAWLNVRRNYLIRHGYRPRGAAFAETPMERAMRRGKMKMTRRGQPK